MKSTEYLEEKCIYCKEKQLFRYKEQKYKTSIILKCDNCKKKQLMRSEEWEEKSISYSLQQLLCFF